MAYTGTRYNATCSMGTQHLTGTAEYVSNGFSVQFPGGNAGERRFTTLAHGLKGVLQQPPFSGTNFAEPAAFHSSMHVKGQNSVTRCAVL